MDIPFSASEIETAAKCLKNNKSPGIDNMNTELLKYGPEEVYQEIADIFNRIAETGEIPQEIQQGILIPVPKPGKPQGPPAWKSKTNNSSFHPKENSQYLHDISNT